VTCCSIFCPTPSLASMLVNKFKLRSDIQVGVGVHASKHSQWSE
jgi:hypothetical protein